MALAALAGYGAAGTDGFAYVPDCDSDTGNEVKCDMTFAAPHGSRMNSEQVNDGSLQAWKCALCDSFLFCSGGPPWALLC